MEKHDYVIIGAGAAGLVVATGLAAAGKDALLIERGTYGGDCTNFGCIPSKALISRANLIHAGASISAQEALSYTRGIVAQILKEESPDALKKRSIETLTGKAKFLDPHTVEVEGTQVQAKKFIIATGSKARIPEIEGLKAVPYLTNETIFELEQAPKSLIVLGGGPIGCELAQAFARLGSKVTIVQGPDHLLGREHPEACAIVAQTFQREGIALFTGERATSVREENSEIVVTLQNGEIRGEHLLVATGRTPNIDSLKVENGHIKTANGAIVVDALARTSTKHIYAIGDATGPPYFTHRAEHHARTLLFNLLVPFFNKKIDKQPMPRCTFTDPEVAAVGITHEEAVTRYGERKIKTYHLPLSEVDRAIATSTTEGCISITTFRLSSKILGATIVGPRAGEMLMEISTAMLTRTPLRSLASLIHPYPIYNHGIRKCADQWLKTLLGKN